MTTSPRLLGARSSEGREIPPSLACAHSPVVPALSSRAPRVVSSSTAGSTTRRLSCHRQSPALPHHFDISDWREDALIFTFAVPVLLPSSSVLRLIILSSRSLSIIRCTGIAYSLARLPHSNFLSLPYLFYPSRCGTSSLDFEGIESFDNHLIDHRIRYR
jgi:hypothetical protein